MSVRFLLDENVDPRAAKVARRFGVDVVTAADEGLLGRSDIEVLASASALGRIVVTYDISDFTLILSDLARAGADVPGVVFVSSRTIPMTRFDALGRALRRLRDLLEAGKVSAAGGLFLG